MADNQTSRTTTVFDKESMARLDVLVSEAKKEKSSSRNKLLTHLINEKWDEYLTNKGYTCTKCGHVLPLTTDKLTERNFEVFCTKCNTKNKR